MLIHVIAHEGCKLDTVRESALKADGKKTKQNNNSKKLTVPGTRTCVDTAPGFSV